MIECTYDFDDIYLLSSFSLTFIYTKFLSLTTLLPANYIFFPTITVDVIATLNFTQHFH